MAHPDKRPDHDPTPLTCDGHAAGFHVDRARVIIDKGYAKWRAPDPTPMTSDEKRALRKHKFCLRDEGRRERIARYRDKVVEQYRNALVARSLTPYPGPGGTHWAIPWSIVACESGGDWGAYNPSGAVGPYQLLGHGAPFPVTSEADKLAHHRIASDLWAGGAGRSAWVC